MSIANESNDIEQVRQLILGNQIQKYDDRFTQLEKSIKELKDLFLKSSESLHRLIEKAEKKNKEDYAKLKESINASGNDLSDSFNKELKRIENELQNLKNYKPDRAELSEFFIEIANKIRKDSK